MKSGSMRLPLLALGLAAALPFAVRAADPQQAGKVLQLDTTKITGEQGQPRVMNIVPWKQPLAAAPAGWPDDSVLDQALQPVNRVEFRRELRYEGALGPGSTSTP